MTAATTGPAPTTLDLSKVGAIPFLTLLRVELRKSIDTRAGLWLLIVIAGFATAVMALQVVVGLTEDLSLRYGSFMESTLYTTGVLLPVLGILLVTSEWSQRTAMVTFALEPRRSRVLLAKLVAGVVLALLVSAVAMAAAALCNLIYAAIAGDPVSWSLGAVSWWGFLAVQVIGMLAGFALAALLLNTAAAIVVFFIYSLVLPTILNVIAFLVDWVADLLPWVDFTSAQEPLFRGTIAGEEWAHLAVSGAVWLALPLAAGWWRMLRAEVK
jgi:ABC-2 type transport system permease protein